MSFSECFINFRWRNCWILSGFNSSSDSSGDVLTNLPLESPWEKCSVGRRGTGQRDRPCQRAWWMLRRVYEPAILQKYVCFFGRLFRRHSFHIEVKLVKMDTSDIERLTNIEWMWIESRRTSVSLLCGHKTPTASRMPWDSFEASLIPNAPYMKQVAPNFGMHNMVKECKGLFSCFCWVATMRYGFMEKLYSVPLYVLDQTKSNNVAAVGSSRGTNWAVHSKELGEIHQQWWFHQS